MNTPLKEYTLSQLPLASYKIWGRTNDSLTPLTLFWTGSALELNVKAAELWLEAETSFTHFEQWAAILVNGDPVTRMPLPEGRHWLPLFRGMDPNTVKNLRFLKEVQPMSQDPDNLLQIHSIRTDGAFLPVETRPRKLEFIGDSITSGEGLAGAKAEMDWIPMFFSAASGFPHLTSESLGAEYRIISQSGWGVLSDWCNDPSHTLAGIYNKVCGPLTGSKNLSLGTQEDHDFSSWQPDAVVINLGTNDGGARNQPPWVDPVTGERFQQTASPEGRARFRAGAAAFLKQLREKNPTAFLVWAYGMLGRDMAGDLREAVAEYQAETGDRRAAFLLLPDTTEETVGSRNHSGKKAHAQAAKVLSDFLKTVWEG